jgi:hypothetical protein
MGRPRYRALATTGMSAPWTLRDGVSADAARRPPEWLATSVSLFFTRALARSQESSAWLAASPSFGLDPLGGKRLLWALLTDTTDPSNRFALHHTRITKQGKCRAKPSS